MKIEHIALWTSDLEASKDFFIEFFNGKSGAKYSNDDENFHSYFISFDGDMRLEIMQKPPLSTKADVKEQFYGFSHIAFSVGSEEAVSKLTEALRSRGYKVVSEPRHTGDGYYESCIIDADNNRIEITV